MKRVTGAHDYNNIKHLIIIRIK